MIVLRRFMLDSRRSGLWWSLGMVALVVTTVGFYPSVKGNTSFEEVFEELPASLRAIVGATEGVPLTSPAGYLHGRLFSTLLPVLLVVLGVGLLARAIGGSEGDGTLELLLANPVSRTRVLVERYAAGVGVLTGVTAVLAVTLIALSPPAGLLEGVSVARLLAAVAAAFCLALFHGTVAFGVGAAVGRQGPAVAVPTVLASAGYLLEGLAAVSEAVRPLRPLSPWHWYLGRNVVADGLDPVAVVVPLALSGVVVAGAVWVFNRRDLR